jgi:predicted nucleic acid-binding protein
MGLGLSRPSVAKAVAASGAASLAIPALAQSCCRWRALTMWWSTTRMPWSSPDFVLSGALVTDAHIAALAIENQAVVHSNDSDFCRFAGLRWLNPLQAGA